MPTAIDRLLKEILEVRQRLGEEYVLLSPKVLSDFLESEHAVLAEGSDGLRENSEADKSSMGAAPNGVGSSESKASASLDVQNAVPSNTSTRTNVYLNPQEANADDNGLTEPNPASSFPFSSVANGFSNMEASNGLKSQVSASAVLASPVSNEDLHAEPIRGSAEQVASVPSNFSQTASEVPEVQTTDDVGIPPVVVLPEGTKASRYQWLKEKVLACPNCLQHVPEGKSPVFGSGNLDAEIFFCGEAPGEEEEERGEVFVGRAGQLLTKIIEAMGLRRSDVYIGNIMNWRPETPNRIGNRPPTQKEMQFCLPYLIGQVEIVRPKVLVALGLTAVNGLLGYDAQRRMRDCRGQWFEFHQIPLLVTYHPSYLLRNAALSAKRTVWEDMLCVMKFLKMPISEKQAGYFL